MQKFNLIQRGNFKNVLDIANGLSGVVEYSYMGSAEFEFNAIPKAYRRLMYCFNEYSVFPTGIYTPEHDELMLFCKTNYATDIIQALGEFIKTPYRLKEPSELEKIPNTAYPNRRNNFWWCIDINEFGDWMAFLESESHILVSAVEHDYTCWWLPKPLETRKEEYQKSLYW